MGKTFFSSPFPHLSKVFFVAFGDDLPFLADTDKAAVRQLSETVCRKSIHSTRVGRIDVKRVYGAGKGVHMSMLKKRFLFWAVYRRYTALFPVSIR